MALGYARYRTFENGLAESGAGPGTQMPSGASDYNWAHKPWLMTGNGPRPQQLHIARNYKTDKATGEQLDPLFGTSSGITASHGYVGSDRGVSTVPSPAGVTTGDIAQAFANVQTGGTANAELMLSYLQQVQAAEAAQGLPTWNDSNINALINNLQAATHTAKKNSSPAAQAAMEHEEDLAAIQLMNYANVYSAAGGNANPNATLEANKEYAAWQQNYYGPTDTSAMQLLTFWTRQVQADIQSGHPSAFAQELENQEYQKPGGFDSHVGDFRQIENNRAALVAVGGKWATQVQNLADMLVESGAAANAIDTSQLSYQSSGFAAINGETSPPNLYSTQISSDGSGRMLDAVGAALAGVRDLYVAFEKEQQLSPAQPTKKTSDRELIEIGVGATAVIGIGLWLYYRG